ncbi:unnamed protein product [Brassicogethes aeneus]|uniref:Uncharacterized protein n=1 Tax=Brassicogethes aeneus TaxID=1431903 RepID=A0A9P0FC05_BRAAE|nr:unnamed protein product [Brassicogethes aeneus]
MWFSLGRTENLPSQYDPQYIPVFAYILEKEIIIAFVILLASFVFCFASSGLERIYYRITHVFIALLIGTFILVENFGQEWEIGSVVSKTPYKAGSSCEILANIEVNLGLRSVNITLRTDDNSNCKIKEIINYNERFEWTWDQGRLGFGPYAGRLQQQFRDAQHRGLPLPILWIADYFIIDGEGFRFGRFYRTAGWYAHILLWAAFATWILTIILNQCVIVYGGYFLFVTGCLQLCAVAVWSMVRNPIPLVIIFEDGNITTRYGPSYWFAMANGKSIYLLSL